MLLLVGCFFLVDFFDGKNRGGGGEEFVGFGGVLMNVGNTGLVIF